MQIMNNMQCVYGYGPVGCVSLVEILCKNCIRIASSLEDDYFICVPLLVIRSFYDIGTFIYYISYMCETFDNARGRIIII